MNNARAFALLVPLACTAMLIGACSVTDAPNTVIKRDQERALRTRPQAITTPGVGPGCRAMWDACFEHVATRRCAGAENPSACANRKVMAFERKRAVARERWLLEQGCPRAIVLDGDVRCPETPDGGPRAEPPPELRDALTQ